MIFKSRYPSPCIGALFKPGSIDGDCFTNGGMWPKDSFGLLISWKETNQLCEDMGWEGGFEANFLVGEEMVGIIGSLECWINHWEQATTWQRR